MYLHLCLVGLLRVEAETLPRPRAAGAPRPLLGGGLADGRDQQRLHPDTRVVHLGAVIKTPAVTHSSALFLRERCHEASPLTHLLFGEAGVDHKHNTVDGQGGFCDVGRHHNLGQNNKGFSTTSLGDLTRNVM